MPLFRRPLGALLTGLVLAGLAWAAAAPAGADSGYRYWGYYHADTGNGAWNYAPKGPDDTAPADGSVEGWRFAITVGESGRVPRAAADFDAICSDTSAENGKKRVAVVIDFGLADEAPNQETPPAPRGACAVVPEQASGTQVLASVADVRVKSGLTCGIDGYPASECAVEMKDVSVPAKDQPVTLQLTRSSASTGLPWAPVGIGVLVLALAAGAWLTVRRRA